MFMGRLADWVDHLFGCDYGISTKAPAVNPADVERRVYDIVCNKYGADRTEVSRETSFKNELYSDSIDDVELVIEFEDAFDLVIPDEDLEKMPTVGAAVEYITKMVCIDRNRQGQQT